MEETNEETTTKPQKGAWDDVKGYPQKITFEQDKTVLVVFDAEFDGPKEMESTDGNSVYYIFECRDGEGTKSSIMTSAWTMLNSLKSHEPLAGKSLLITQKVINGKKQYYVQKEGTYNAPKPEEPSEVETDDVGIAEDDTI